MNQLQGHSISYRIAEGPHQGHKVFTLQFESTAAVSGKRAQIIGAGPSTLPDATHMLDAEIDHFRKSG